VLPPPLLLATLLAAGLVALLPVARLQAAGWGPTGLALYWLALVGLALALVAVSVVALLSKSGFVAPLAAVRQVAVPGLGDVGVTDGRGIIQREVQGDGYDIGPVTRPLPVLHKRWLPVARDVVGWSLRRAERRDEPLNLTLGIDDRIFGNSRLIAAAQLWFHRYLSVDYLVAENGGTVASYRRQLESPQPENALITGEPPPNGSSVSRATVERAARSLGFVRVRSFALPDGRTIWLWWR